VPPQYNVPPAEDVIGYREGAGYRAKASYYTRWQIEDEWDLEHADKPSKRFVRRARGWKALRERGEEKEPLADLPESFAEWDEDPTPDHKRPNQIPAHFFELKGWLRDAMLREDFLTTARTTTPNLLQAQHWLVTWYHLLTSGDTPPDRRELVTLLLLSLILGQSINRLVTMTYHRHARTRLDSHQDIAFIDQARPYLIIRPANARPQDEDQTDESITGTHYLFLPLPTLLAEALRTLVSMRQVHIKQRVFQHKARVYVRFAKRHIARQPDSRRRNTVNGLAHYVAAHLKDQNYDPAQIYYLTGTAKGLAEQPTYTQFDPANVIKALQSHWQSQAAEAAANNPDIPALEKALMPASPQTQTATIGAKDIPTLTWCDWLQQVVAYRDRVIQQAGLIRPPFHVQGRQRAGWHDTARQIPGIFPWINETAVGWELQPITIKHLQSVLQERDHNLLRKLRHILRSWLSGQGVHAVSTDAVINHGLINQDAFHAGSDLTVEQLRQQIIDAQLALLNEIDWQPLEVNT